MAQRQHQWRSTTIHQSHQAQPSSIQSVQRYHGHHSHSHSHKIMWAASTRSSTAWPFNIESTSSSSNRRPERSFIVTFSAKPRRKSQPQKDESIQDMGNLGHAVAVAAAFALKSNPQNNTTSVNTFNSRPKPQQQKQLQSLVEQGELSGSDVLWALQKATAQKNMKKKRGFSSASLSASTRSRSRGRNSAKDQENEDSLDHGNVRPLCLKSDWSTRLHELDRRLQELIDT
ncbi:unnamed protein product [Ilex paraguariensis]|uniref:Uncharacterized protein n=1 Tax=Ilex paraguariensis TaxID=185542 RepID=A0ABC8RNN2_9AQUA